jgi:hypothetical protein
MVGTIPNSKRIIVEIETKSIPLAYIYMLYDRSLSLLETGTLIKSGEAKLVSWSQADLRNCNIL